jgi:hypothetical protein
MRRIKEFGTGVSAGKCISSVMLICCLIFLTSLNYFVYPSADSGQQVASMMDHSEDNSNKPNPSGPTEEKSGSSGFSILEEFLHENHPSLNFEILNQQYQHQVAEADKIPVFHGDLVSPPPKA